MSGFKDQLGDTLYYPDVPGHRGVATSVIAAHSMLPHVSRLAQKVIDHLERCGAHGATYTEIMTACDLGAPTTAARMRELVLARRITKTDQRRPTPSGRPAAVYISKKETVR